MSDEENQIEETKQLARDIFECGTALDGIDFVHAAVNGADDDPESHFMRIARRLYVTKGYRKALQVAREISQDILEPIWKTYSATVDGTTKLLVALILEFINTELKKKYESEEKL